MKLSFKYRFKKRSLIIAFIGISFIFMHSCMHFRTSDKKTLKEFSKANVPIKINYFKSTLYSEKVRIVTTAAKKDTTIIFIHGAPGSGDAFYDYLKDTTLLQKAKLVTIDRPGYGYSGLGNSLISIKKQAQIIHEICNAYGFNNVFLVGHSFGGPIAAYVPTLTHKINGVLLLAPAIDPDHEKILWIANFAKWKATKWLVPKSFAVSGDEKFSHSKELQKIKNEWYKVTIPVTHIHGEKDGLVPYENLAFSRQKFNDSIFKSISLAKENHFIPWTQKSLVIEEILKLLDQKEP